MGARLGQNFLTDPAYQRRVADAVQVCPGENLLEIGGGPGVLSALLADRGAKLTIVEYDPVLAGRLQQQFAARSNVSVLHADILDVDLRALAADAPLKIFGNLPYYITSPILVKIFHASLPPQTGAPPLIPEAIVMMQREVAVRLLAAPGSPDFGLLSASTQYFAAPGKLFDLPPGAFRPAPKVTSTLVRLRLLDRRRELGCAPEQFESFARLAFAQKRKRLTNNLRSLAAPPLVEEALRSLGLSPQVRAEQLSVEQLAALLLRLKS